MPAPSLLELQRERRETTELGYPGQCRRQPRKHTGPVPTLPAPSLLELQRERKETTELGYPGWCRRQPQKHAGPVPVHPWQRAWFMARDPGLRGKIGLRHRPGSTHLGTARPGLGFFLLFGSLKPGRWDLGLGTWIGRDSGLGTGGTVLKVTWVLGPR